MIELGLEIDQGHDIGWRIDREHLTQKLLGLPVYSKHKFDGHGSDFVKNPTAAQDRRPGLRNGTGAELMALYGRPDRRHFRANTTV